MSDFGLRFGTNSMSPMTLDEYEKLPSEEKEHFAECLACDEIFDRRSPGEPAPYPERERADHFGSSTSKSHARVFAAY